MSMRSSIVAILLAGVSGAHLSAQRFAVAGIDDDSTVSAFLQQLQDAVRRGDRRAVSAFVRFPVAVTDSLSKSTARDRDHFIAQYEQIVTANVQRAILTQVLDSLFATWRGVMIGNGHVWLQMVDGELAIVAINRDAPAMAQRSAPPN